MRRKSEFHQAESRSLWKLVTDLEVNDLQTATRQLNGALLDRWFHIAHVLPKTLATRLPCLKCVFRRSRPLIPTRSRPPYRFEAGHHSDVKPAI